MYQVACNWTLLHGLFLRLQTQSTNSGLLSSHKKFQPNNPRNGWLEATTYGHTWAWAPFFPKTWSNSKFFPGNFRYWLYFLLKKSNKLSVKLSSSLILKFCSKTLKNLKAIAFWAMEIYAWFLPFLKVFWDVKNIHYSKY